MPTKKQYQTRLAPDTADSVDEYADRHDVTSAEALRRLVKAGLDTEQDDTLDPEEIRADLRELRQAIEDEADEDGEDDVDEDGREVKTWYQVGGTSERAAGLVLAAVIPALVALGLFGPEVAAIVGTLTLGVVVYFATVALATLVT